mmetsp:Transcript_25644/g.64628  ORF Transcript_25644/g.64628 Transcript_25644/m.64628 type:complete len:456 (+) Transcript_25644:114-1481(+)
MINSTTETLGDCVTLSGIAYIGLGITPPLLLFLARENAASIFVTLVHAGGGKVVTGDDPSAQQDGAEGPSLLQQPSSSPTDPTIPLAGIIAATFLRWAVCLAILLNQRGQQERRADAGRQQIYERDKRRNEQWRIRRLSTRIANIAAGKLSVRQPVSARSAASTASAATSRPRSERAGVVAEKEARSEVVVEKAPPASATASTPATHKRATANWQKLQLALPHRLPASEKQVSPEPGGETSTKTLSNIEKQLQLAKQRLDANPEWASPKQKQQQCGYRENRAGQMIFESEGKWSSYKADVEQKEADYARADISGCDFLYLTALFAWSVCDLTAVCLPVGGGEKTKADETLFNAFYSLSQLALVVWNFLQVRNAGFDRSTTEGKTLCVACSALQSCILLVLALFLLAEMSSGGGQGNEGADIGWVANGFQLAAFACTGLTFYGSDPKFDELQNERR